ncbi:MAG: DUF427 domain-containing protein [Pseudomonadota bacterium]
MTDAIYNPSNPKHFMQLDAIDQTVRIMFAGETVARTRRAMRLLESGKRLYAPQYYIPLEDISVPLSRTHRTTHCPLKGDASYFSIADVAGAEEIGWAYERPFEFAARLSDHIAFDLRRASIVIDALEA